MYRSESKLRCNQLQNLWYWLARSIDGEILVVIIDVILPLSQKIDDKIIVNQGEHPMLFHVRTAVNIGIPRSFTTGKIEVRNQAGSLYAQDLVTEKFNVQINAGSFKVKNMDTKTADWQLASGSIKATHIKAEQAKIHAQLGAVNISDATIDYAKVNADFGSVRIDNLVGGGEFTINSGSLRLRVDQLTNDLKLNSNSGTIRLTAPADQDFNLN
ncbi:DUF4097 domain-containing protein [Lactococcus lactis]|nr:DUF4097 domain-containing protein [Lactococcus lactis]